MRMLCGLTHPTTGHAAIEGADFWKRRCITHRASIKAPRCLTWSA
jgi:ABC-type multidrug transport system ATPase subunit